MKKINWIALLVIAFGWIQASVAVLPDNLEIDVGDIDNDGQDDVLILTKRSVRGPNYRVMVYDKAKDSYTQVPTPEVRTYRGYVESDPSMRVNAVIEPGNILHAFMSDGRNINARVVDLQVAVSGREGTADPGSGNTPAPFTQSRVSPTAGGYVVPKYTMRKMSVGVDIAYDYYLGVGKDLETAVARVESRINDSDFFYARDMGMAWEIQECVVRVNGEPSNWKTWWTDETSVYINSKMKFKWPGGGGSSGRVFNSATANHQHTSTLGSSAAYSRSLGHEVAHGFGAGHASSWDDTMGGSKSCLGTSTVQRMIDHGHVALEAASPALVYGAPLPPFAMEDGANTLKDTPVEIDLLENDYDGNGDSISLGLVDSTTHKGGLVVKQVGGVVRYTPPIGFLGMDEFTYQVADSTGLTNRHGYVKVYVHNEGLVTHLLFDETSGTIAYDVGPYQAHGSLKGGLDFDSAVAGKMGGALLCDDSKPTARVECEGTGDPMQGDLSVSFWVKYPARPTATGVLACKGGAVIPSRINNPRGGWFMGHLANGTFCFGGNLQRDLSGSNEENSEKFDRHSTTPIKANQWYHLVMVLDRSDKTIRAWVDGVEQTASDWSTVVPDGMIEASHHPLVLFDSQSQQDQGTDTICALDDFRIYNKVLTSTEIAELYSAEGEIPAGAPSPANRMTDVLVGFPLSWTPGKPATYLFDVYFGTNSTAVLNATTASPEYLGRQADVSIIPATLSGSRYYWRIDEVVGATTVTGDVWWFETSKDIFGLADPTVVNGSFEDPVLGFGENSDDINSWWDAVAFTYTAHEGSTNHPATPYGDNWAELDKGRWMYQQIGTYRENMELDISFLLGRRNDKRGLNVYVNLLVGGDPTLAKDVKVQIDENPLVDVVGATVITNSAVIPPLAEIGATAEQRMTLSTGTGHLEGLPLWLQIVTTDVGNSARVLIDNVQVVDTSVVNKPPRFHENPISADDGEIGALYSDSIASHASDPENKPVSFSKVSGPSWLIVTPDGELSGTPGLTANGLNTFIVEVRDSKGGTAETKLEIDVFIDDSDEDGMSDLWEKKYFPNGIAALPGDNADGDMHSNLEEFIAGTDPTNAQAYFQITAVPMGTNGFVLEWPSVEGRFYRVYKAESPTNTFQILKNDLEFPCNSYTDTVHQAEGQSFYKVDVRLK